MGIVNLTDDSFFAGSRVGVDGVSERVAQMLADGADIIDLGGCSTRPGAELVSEEQEWQRIEGALKSLAQSECRLSIDTYRVGVAERALQMRDGLIINDISGGSEAMFELVGGVGAEYVLTHSVGAERGASVVADDADIVSRVCRFFERRLAELQRYGAERVILDVGIGFSGSVENDFRLLGGLSEFARFGLPVLVGVSRKRLVWHTIGASAEEALGGSLVLGWQALMGGATILRTHDIAPTRQMFEIFERYKALNG